MTDQPNKVIWRIVALNETGNAESDHETIDAAGEAVKRLLEQGYAVSVAAHEVLA